MVDYSQSVSTISRGENGASSKDASQLGFAGEAILRLLHKAVGAAEAPLPTSFGDRRKSSQANFVLPKIGSRSQKRKFISTVRSLNTLKSGCAKFPWKLRIALLMSRKRSDDKCRDEPKPQD